MTAAIRAHHWVIVAEDPDAVAERLMEIGVGERDPATTMRSV